MDVALLQQIAAVLLQIVELGIKIGPKIISDLRETYSLATSGTTLTADQLAHANQTLQNAHAELQAQLQKDITDDNADATADTPTDKG